MMHRRQFLSSLTSVFVAPRRRAGRAGWNPLTDPRGQAGLLWHNDWGAQYNRADVNRGSWVRGLGGKGETYAPLVLKPGKFTSALAWREGGNGPIFYPSQGILPAHNFWFGMWMHIEKDMADWKEPGILFLGNDYQKIYLQWFAPQKLLAADLATSQGKIQRGGGPKFMLPTLPVAGEWVHLGLRVAEGSVRVYLNGKRCPARNEGDARIARPLFEDGVMDAAMVVDGIVPMYNIGRNTPQTGFSCSDLHLFAGAPEPNGTAPTPIANRLTVTPATTPTGTRLTRRMLGCCQWNNHDPGAEKRLKGIIGCIRMAGLLLASPIEATKSAATPTAGLSPGSRWFWDTQVLHRTVDWCFACADEVLLDLGGVPTALQDPAFPRTTYLKGRGVQTEVSCIAAWLDSLPNWRGTNARDAAGKVVLSQETANAYAEAAADLYFLTRAYCREKGYDFKKIRWAFWNEPDGAGFWQGQKTFADPPRELWKLLRALVKRVRPLDKEFSVDVAGFAGTEFYRTWLPTLFEDAVKNGYAEGIRAVHYHSYDGLAFEGLEFVMRETERLRLAAGMPRPLPVLVGEYAWTAVRMVGSSPDWPKGKPEYSWGCTSWQAGQTARLTLQAARLQNLGGGVESLHLFNPMEYAPLKMDFGATGLLHRSDLTPHAPLNAMRLLRRMVTDDAPPARHGTTIWRGVPGVSHLCTVLPDGTVRILLARQAWRADDEKTVTIDFPTAYANRPVKRFVVNDRHSSQYEAGAAHTELETVPQLPVSTDGTIKFPMRGREVTLIEVSGRQ